MKKLIAIIFFIPIFSINTMFCMNDIHTSTEQNEQQTILSRQLQHLDERFNEVKPILDDGSSGVEISECLASISRANEAVEDGNFEEAYRLYKKACFGNGESPYSVALTSLINECLDIFCFQNNTIDGSLVIAFSEHMGKILHYAMFVSPCIFSFVFVLQRLMATEPDKTKAIRFQKEMALWHYYNNKLQKPIKLRHVIK